MTTPTQPAASGDVTQGRFRKKPVVIEAQQFFVDGPVCKGVHWARETSDDGEYLRPYVVTVHGQVTWLVDGDWIIPEPKEGCFYPCKPDIFAATYEPEGLSTTPAGEREREAVARIVHKHFYAVVTGHDDCLEWDEMPQRIRDMYLAGADRILALPPATQAGDGEAFSGEDLPDLWAEIKDTLSRVEEGFANRFSWTINRLLNLMRVEAERLLAPTQPKAEPSVAEGVSVEVDGALRAALLASATEVETLAPAIPAGMKPWPGGDSAPEDWDSGGPVLYRDGDTVVPFVGDNLAWQHDTNGDGKPDLADLIAYTPLATPQPEASVELREVVEMDWLRGDWYEAYQDCETAIDEGGVTIEDLERLKGRVDQTIRAALKSGGAK